MLDHIGTQEIKTDRPLNPASGKVMLKSGMTFEGRIRGGSKLAGEICDCLQYSILRDDWIRYNRTL
jgi:ribosomal-protein-alanine N-acetyltransferase